MQSSKSQFQIKSFFVPVVIIAFAVVLRLLPHPPNVAPITAMALFGGVYVSKRFALLIPLAAMLVSDIVLGFHDTMIFVYASFFISGLIGLGLKKRKTFQNIFSGALCASLMFFILTNFGVWLVSGMYERTLSGLVDAYTLAIPFYRNTIIGDLLYTGLFFVGYELALRLTQYANLHENRR